jgi:NADPH:quinone reductase-like Zn-dependent oxidoreductase
MSRVVTFSEFGGPEVLKIVDVAVPEPRAREIRIRVKAIGLNRAESMWRRGEYGETAKLPARLGYEVSGIVDAVGGDVSHVAIGDEVTTLPAFSMNDYGLYGELVLAPSHAVVEKLPSLSFEEAVAIWSPFVTPWGAFAETHPLTADDVVVVTAASSSVGLGAIQVARSLDATAIALTRTKAKKDQLLKAGADHVVVTDDEDLSAGILRITHSKGASVVFDPVGGTNFVKLIDAMAPAGTLWVYGSLSEEVTPLPMLAVLSKQIVIRGYNTSGITTTPNRQAEAVRFVYEGITSGKLKVTVAQIFPFDQIVEAHRALEGNKHVGKIVVTM